MAENLMATASLASPAEEPAAEPVGLEWGFSQMSARLDRQLAQVDGLDTKGGIFFAYCVAVIGAAAALDPGFIPVARLAAIAFGLVALFMYFQALRIRGFEDAPRAEAIDEVARGAAFERADVLESFMKDQLEAIKMNRRVIEGKVSNLQVGDLLAAAATIALIVQVVGKGVN